MVQLTAMLPTLQQIDLFLLKIGSIRFMLFFLFPFFLGLEIFVGNTVTNSTEIIAAFVIFVLYLNDVVTAYLRRIKAFKNSFTYGSNIEHLNRINSKVDISKILQAKFIGKKRSLSYLDTLFFHDRFEKFYFDLFLQSPSGVEVVDGRVRSIRDPKWTTPVMSLTREKNKKFLIFVFLVVLFQFFIDQLHLLEIYHNWFFALSVVGWAYILARETYVRAHLNSINKKYAIICYNLAIFATAVGLYVLI